MSMFHRIKTTASLSVSTASLTHRHRALRFKCPRALLLVGVLAFTASESPATSGNWVSTSSSDWAVAANWSTTPPAGTTNSTANTETATFKGASYQSTVLPDANRCIGNILFSQLGSGNAGNYTLGSTTGNALYLGQGGTGSVTVDAALTTPNVTETINAPLIINGSYQFFNNSTNPTVTLILGDISNGSAAHVDVQLKGGNTGYNRARGVISDGTVTTSLTKLNAGTWYVTGTNSTYTKNTNVGQGTLILAADLPASGPSAFGNSSSLIYVGNSSSVASLAQGDASLLVGMGTNGYTIARTVTVQSLNAARQQTAGLGGANTSGVSRFTGSVSIYRAFFLQCATGGTVSFEGTWTTRNYGVTIGRPGYLGTVRIANSLSTTAGVVVSNGTLEVAGTITAAVSVNSGATLAGTGTLSGNVVVAGNATCAPGTDGVGTLTVNGDATFQSGSRFAVNVAPNGTVGKLTSPGAISLDDVVLDVTSPEAFAGTVVIAHADTALTGTFSAASELPAFCSVVYTANEAKLRFTTGTLVTVR